MTGNTAIEATFAFPTFLRTHFYDSYVTGFFFIRILFVVFYRLEIRTRNGGSEQSKVYRGFKLF